MTDKPDVAARLRKLISYGRDQGMKMDVEEDALRALEAQAARIAELEKLMAIPEEGYSSPFDYLDGIIKTKDARIEAQTSELTRLAAEHSRLVDKGFDLIAERDVWKTAAVGNYTAEQRRQRELIDAKAEIARLMEWKTAIIGLCKALGSDDMAWGGDKTGWGLIHYFVKHLHTRATTAEAEIARLRDALTKVEYADDMDEVLSIVAALKPNIGEKPIVDRHADAAIVAANEPQGDERW